MNSQKSYQTDGPTLYVVPTPIGNLEDMTYRAVRILGEVDLIAAEDTRQTMKLCRHFGIETKLVSYHEHNKHVSGPRLIEDIEAGKSVAVVSDAGMPGISDPGSDLVRLAIEAKLPVVVLPGANAASPRRARGPTTRASRRLLRVLRVLRGKSWGAVPSSPARGSLSRPTVGRRRRAARSPRPSPRARSG